MLRFQKLLFTLLVFLIASVFFLTFDSDIKAFAGGAGTSGDPYQITTPAHLVEIGSYLGSGNSNKYFKLMNDIDLNVSPYNTGSGWTPIGSSGSGFHGKLDGNNKVISNLYYNRASSTYSGLFAHVGNGGRISYLGLTNINITGDSVAGGLVGYVAAGGTVEFSYATGTASFDNHWSGGLVGSNYGTINQCYSLVNVTSTGGQVVGSLAGENFGGGTMSDSYARGSVTTNTINTGGLIGNNHQSTLNRSYSTGLVTAPVNSSNRGLVGGNINIINNGYWDTQTSGQSAATTGATGLTTAQMKDSSNYSGWNFSTVWAIDPSINDGYPYLRWQQVNSAPSSPSSLGPSNLINASWGADNTPTFSFTLSDPNGSDTIRYRIQIDNNMDFSSPMVDYTSALASAGSASFTVGQATGSGSYTVGSASQTLANGQYYWRVKAIDNSAAESSYSTANSGNIAFRIDANAPSTPSVPSTTSPTTDNTPTWTFPEVEDEGSGFGDLVLQWSKDSNFLSGVSSDTVAFHNPGAPAPDPFTHSTPLSDGTWYFRFKVVDAADNESSYSSAGSVLIDTTAPSVPGTPSSSSSLTDQTPAWVWTASTDSGSGLNSTAYTVEWSQNLGFASVTGSTTSNTNSFTHSTELTEGTWYFRVKAKDVLNNESSYSSAGSFVIDLPDPAPSNSNNQSSNTAKAKQTTVTTTISEVVEEETQEAAATIIDTLPSTYNVTITVLDQNGSPVEGARVELYSMPRIAYSDRRGRVTFTDVEKGEHRLLVFYRDQQSEKNIWAGPKPGEVWAAEGNEVKVDVRLLAAVEVSGRESLYRWFSFVAGVFATILIFLLLKRFKKLV